MNNKSNNNKYFSSNHERSLYFKRYFSNSFFAFKIQLSYTSIQCYNYHETHLLIIHFLRVYLL